MSLKIGNITLKHGIFLAPMAGVTDRTFRNICREHGAEFTVSEMVSAKSLCYEQNRRKAEPSETKSASLASVYKEDLPMAVQIFGCDKLFMARAAQMIENNSYTGCLSEAQPSAIDINMGCPVRKVTSNGEGSALMKAPELAGEIVREICNTVKLPVTVKIRAGWDSESVNAPEMAKILEDAGASAIFVHARTRQQLYAPGIDIDVITRTKKAVSIPVIGNGDINTASDALRMLEITGCDGIMVARGAMGNPWIFDEITAALEGREFLPPSAGEIFATAMLHLERTVAQKGERTGVAEAKKSIAWYIRDVKGAAAARHAVMNAVSTEEISEILNRLTRENGG